MRALFFYLFLIVTLFLDSLLSPIELLVYLIIIGLTDFQVIMHLSYPSSVLDEVMLLQLFNQSTIIAVSEFLFSFEEFVTLITHLLSFFIDTIKLFIECLFGLGFSILTFLENIDLFLKRLHFFLELWKTYYGILLDTLLSGLLSIHHVFKLCIGGFILLNSRNRCFQELNSSNKFLLQFVVT